MRAKALLEQQGVDFEWIDSTTDQGNTKREEMSNKYQYPTVPLILQDDHFIGGYTELVSHFQEQ